MSERPVGVRCVGCHISARSHASHSFFKENVSTEDSLKLYSFRLRYPFLKLKLEYLVYKKHVNAKHRQIDRELLYFIRSLSHFWPRCRLRGCRSERHILHLVNVSLMLSLHGKLIVIQLQHTQYYRYFKNQC